MCFIKFFLSFVLFVCFVFLFRNVDMSWTFLFFFFLFLKKIQQMTSSHLRMEKSGDISVSVYAYMIALIYQVNTEQIIYIIGTYPTTVLKSGLTREEKQRPNDSLSKPCCNCKLMKTNRYI